MSVDHKIMYEDKDGIKRFSPAYKCQWVEDETIWHPPQYKTSCGELWYFESDTIYESDFKYCPFCGDEIKAPDR